eukprot:1123326-Pyramimonas_sp.AAC.1
MVNILRPHAPHASPPTEPPQPNPKAQIFPRSSGGGVGKQRQKHMWNPYPPPARNSGLRVRLGWSAR